jgi:hypothetical protein
MKFSFEYGVRILETLIFNQFIRYNDKKINNIPDEERVILLMPAIYRYSSNQQPAK